MMIRTFLMLLFGFASLLWQSAEASNQTVSHEKAELQLLWEYEELVVGESVGVGIEVRPIEGWHSYWRNPGDSGAPPRIRWNPSAAVEIQPLQFPQPIRIEMAEIVTFGYERPVLFFSNFRIPFQSSVKAGDEVRLKINSEFLVCEDICIPVLADFEKTFRVVEANEAQASPYRDRFQKARRELPARASDVFAFEVTSSKDTFRLEVNPLEGRDFVPVDFFPAKSVGVSLKKPKIEAEEDFYELTFNRQNEKAEFGGLVLYEDQKTETTRSAWIPVSVYEEAASALLWIILSATLGGLILNLMPCVFPVISIKVFSLIKKASGAPKVIIRDSLAYTAGVFVTFFAIALLISLLRVSGESVGWGFQLQSSTFVAAMAILFFVLGLNFVGVFDFNFSFGGLGQGATQKRGIWGEFFTGVLSVIVASPCTAPFMGAALGYTLSQGVVGTFAVFSGLALGLSLPYLFFAFFPKAARHLPRPGKWMEQLKQFLAFPMWATSLWLVWLVSQQGGNNSGFLVALSILFVGLFFWSVYHAGFQTRGVRWALGLLSLLCALFSVTGALQMANSSTVVKTQSSTEGVSWIAFSRDELESRLAAGESVFIDFTADWCLTCKVNERVTFSQKSVQEFIKERDITMMKADWTNRDPEITRMLESYERIGVPLYLYFKQGSERAKILPEILTPEIFMSNIEPNQP